MLLNGARIGKPGPDRAFVFQEFDQLLPWKTVRDNVVFALTASGKLAKKAATERALHFIDKVGLTQVRRQLPAHAVGRHEAARRDRARDGHGAADPAHGRAVRGARRVDARQDAGGPARSSGRTRGSRCVFVTHSIPEAIRIGNRILLLTPHPGRAKAEINCHGLRYASAPAASCCRRGFNGCCSIAREPSPMSEEHAVPPS